MSLTVAARWSRSTAPRNVGTLSRSSSHIFSRNTAVTAQQRACRRGYMASSNSTLLRPSLLSHVRKPTITSFSSLGRAGAGARAGLIRVEARAGLTDATGRTALVLGRAGAGAGTAGSSAAFSTSATLSGPRITYDPSHFVRKRRHGFLSRIRTRTGRAILRRRRQKGRRNLSH